jgi:mitochondrial fission protein ELM1
MSASQRPAAAAPVWLLLGEKAGDNNQVRALGESLGRPFEVRRLTFRPTEIWSNLLLGPNLAGIDAASRAGLRPPWPRLVITAGRRNEPVARWIRQQADHRVRLVHVGRPWAPLENWDLIVTTAQYRLPDLPNVLRVDLPLHRIHADALEQAAKEWADRLQHLPGPRIAVLVGGQSGPYVLDSARAANLGRQARDLARSLGGSLMITTSARTPAHAAEAIDAELDVPRVLHEWRPGQSENPYLAYLALADRFIVTGESMSMLTEACATRKPVYIYDLRASPAATVGPADRLREMRHALGYRAMTHRLAQRFAPVRMRRDITALHEALIAQGRAVWLGEPFPETPVPPLPDGAEATRRVLSLLEEA